MFKYLALVVVLGVVCYGEEQLRSSQCTARNGYYSIPGSCDTYVECRDYAAVEMLCPDGLHYNPEAPWPTYPCGYPMDVPCKGRGAAQPPRANSECPHLYGFYQSPHASRNNCGQYRMCVEGRAVEMMCPPGLAFNVESAQCDWPDLVADCDPDSFLGFKCPAAPLAEDGRPVDTVINYRYEGNCFAFYSCHEGRARLLTCDAGYAFNPNTGHCEDADKVACKAEFHVTL